MEIERLNNKEFLKIRLLLKFFERYKMIAYTKTITAINNLSIAVIVITLVITFLLTCTKLVKKISSLHPGVIFNFFFRKAQTEQCMSQRTSQEK